MMPSSNWPPFKSLEIYLLQLTDSEVGQVFPSSFTADLFVFLYLFIAWRNNIVVNNNNTNPDSDHKSCDSVLSYI